MQYVVILQSAANVLVVVQYGMRGELSASGVCALGAIETLILFFINKKGKRVPWYFTAGFIIAGVALSVTMMVINGFRGFGDIIPLISVFTFNFAMVQSRSHVARLLMFINTALWLVLNIVVYNQSLFISYTVLLVMALVGIIRLDLGEWRAFFKKLGAEKENK